MFQFEQDKYYALRRVPMVMRTKLDLCGIKLSLRDWTRFSRSDREALAAMPCESDVQLAAFRARVGRLIASVDGDSGRKQPCLRPAPWEMVSHLPASVRQQIPALGIRAPAVEQWAVLTDLQRYALIQLKRAGGRNEKLPAALQ